jgi:Outer membrane protein beta-barrel domain
MSARPARLLFVGCHVLCLVLCLGASAAAQSRLGVTAGLNWSGLAGDAPEDAQYSRTLGGVAGIVGDIALSKDVALSLQPMYVRRGANIAFDVGEEAPRDSLELRLDYIDCLTMVKIYADNGFSYFSTGVGVGFLTKATLKDIRAEEKDVASFFRNVDVSVVFGVGFMVPAKSTLMTFELRYQQSLVNMFDPSAEMFAEGLSPRLRSSGFQLLVTVLFPGRS